MKKRFTLSSLLHHDKLMMVVSLILAVLIWSLVVYGPSNDEERVITGVPVSITLNDYATETLKLRITKGAEATATVKVKGLRSVVGMLSPQDLTVTADTGNVISEGTYTLPIRAVATGEYEILSVVGTDGNNDAVTISCDSWREADFAVEVESPGLQVSDTKEYQLGTPSIAAEGITNGKITVSGPRTDIHRIQKVVAVIADEKTIDEATAFEALLQARDEDGKVIESVAFVGVEDAKVSVTVPVMVYREVTLKPLTLHTPKAYEKKADLVTVSPAKVALWGVPSEIDEYVASVQEQMKVDFDSLNADNMTREITLEAIEGIRPVNGSETVKLKVNLPNLSKRMMEFTLAKNNLKLTKATEKWNVDFSQTKLTAVTLYGPAESLNAVKPADIRVVVDTDAITAAGNQTAVSRLEVTGREDVWVYYGAEVSGVDILLTVTEK